MDSRVYPFRVKRVSLAILLFLIIPWDKWVPKVNEDFQVLLARQEFAYLVRYPSTMTTFRLNRLTLLCNLRKIFNTDSGGCAIEGGGFSNNWKQPASNIQKPIGLLQAGNHYFSKKTYLQTLQLLLQVFLPKNYTKLFQALWFS